VSALAIPAASAGVIAAIDRWHAFMRGDDATALDELLHDDVVLYSPVVFTPPRGKELVAMGSR
jgi:ketosteroid isomerase-like protein